MTDQTTAAIKYAIRLPNGELAHDLLFEERVGGTKKQLPNGEYVYLWDGPVAAQNTVLNIGRMYKRLGIQGLFPEHADVVKVRITVEIHDGNDQPLSDYSETASETPEPPRTWNSVTEIPVGTRFRLRGVFRIYERRGIDCLHLATGSMHALHDFPDGEQGFIEVLP